MIPPDSDLPEEDEALTIRGRIEETSLPELLRSFLTSGETGILTFNDGEIIKKIFLQLGRVTYASSTNPDERLGEALLLRGKITARQYLEASKLIRPGRRLGAVLVDLEALEPEELIPAVEMHVRDVIMELFSWTRGDYELVMKEIEPSSITLNISTENLILDGIRRSASWSRVYRGIGSLDAVPVPTGATDVLYKLNLSEEEQEILANVNGRSTIEHICQVSYLSNFETCRVLWGLQVLGVIRPGHAEETVRAGEGAKERERELDLEEIVEKFNQMLSRAYTFLRGRIGDGVDEFMEGVLQQASHQYAALFAEVNLRNYGRADYDQMLANVADLPADQRKRLMIAGLNELVVALQLAVRLHRGAQEEAVVSGIIKDGFRRLGAA
jgi:hypothetical protein